MKRQELSKKAKKAGFNTIDDFIEANIHYLPKSKQKLFHIFHNNLDITKDYDKGKLLKEYHPGKLSYQKRYYNGKG